MTTIFMKILSMSITASYCILFVCIARLLLKKAPKIFSYILWSIVAFRLICPFSFESMFSLVGKSFVPTVNQENIELSAPVFQWNTVQTADIINMDIEDTGADIDITGTDAAENTSPIIMNSTIPEHHADKPTAFENQRNTKSFRDINFMEILAYVWILAACLLIAYGFFTYVHLQQKLKRYAHNRTDYHAIPVWQVTGLDTPFVLGLVRPAIYLPENLSPKDAEQCLAHEYTHIRRKDYWVKQLAFWLVCIYWFNPLVWLAFYLMTKDMEMSCDEVALKSTDLEDRKAYSNTLLELSTANKYFNGCPLAFGSNSTKARIKNIMNYKHPGFWAMILAVILVLVCVIGLCTNPDSKESTNSNEAVKLENQTISLDTYEVVDKKENSDIEVPNMIQNPDDILEIVPVTTSSIADYYDFMLAYRQKYQEMLTLLREKGSTLNESVSASQQQFFTDMESIIQMAVEPLTALQINPAYSDIQGRQYRLFAQINLAEGEYAPVCDSYTDIDDITSKKMSMPEAVYEKLVNNKLQNGDFVEILHYGAVFDIPKDLTDKYALICWEPWNPNEKNSGYVSIDCLNLDVPENTDVTYLFAAGNYLMNENRLPETKDNNILPLHHIIVEDVTHASITYYEQTTDNTIVNCKQELTLTSPVNKTDNIQSVQDLFQNYISECEMTSYGKIHSLEEFQKVYGVEAPFSVFDFTGSGFVLLLKEQKENAEDYADPIRALEHYLHLEGGIGSITAGKEQGSVSVAYTFTDGYTVNIPMYQLSAESSTNPSFADKSDTFWCIDLLKLNEKDNWKTLPTINQNFSDAEKQQLLDKYTTYLNDRENNNLFVTRIYHGTKIDLDMLLYDCGAMLENAPFAEGELEMLARENYNEQHIMYHYTTEQIDTLLQSKMNLSLADVCYKEGEENTLSSDKSGWLYLEAYDTYTMLAKGDTLLHDIICTDIKQLYNGGILVSYKSAHKQPWIKDGLLYMRPRTNDSHIKSPEEFYFYANRFLEGGYQDTVIFE